MIFSYFAFHYFNTIMHLLSFLIFDIKRLTHIRWWMRNKRWHRLLERTRTGHSVDNRIPRRNRNRQREQACIRSYSRIIDAIHTPKLSRDAADSETHATRARRHVKRDRAWARDTGRHNGNGTSTWQWAWVNAFSHWRRLDVRIHAYIHTLHHWVNAPLSSVAHLRRITHALDRLIPFAFPSRAR